MSEHVSYIHTFIYCINAISYKDMSLPACSGLDSSKRSVLVFFCTWTTHSLLSDKKSKLLPTLIVSSGLSNLFSFFEKFYLYYMDLHVKLLTVKDSFRI